MNVVVMMTGIIGNVRWRNTCQRLAVDQRLLHRLCKADNPASMVSVTNGVQCQTSINIVVANACSA